MRLLVIVSRSPMNPADVIVEAEEASSATVAAAVSAGRAAARDWMRVPATERAGRLYELADRVDARSGELVDLIVREVAKPRSEARQEVARSGAILRFHAACALDPDGETHPAAPPADRSTLLLSRRRPHGVAGLITPWNFPLAIPLWKLAPALAYGNVVLLKPSPEAIAVALRLEELATGVLPADVLRVLPGEAVTGEALAGAADVLSFTGSARVGRSVAVVAASRGIPFQCEMGGCNASIVLPDADRERAARAVAAGAMSYSGQKCTATSRIIIVGDGSDFIDALTDAVEGLAVGDPEDDETVIGPLINPAAEARFRSAIERAEADGGRIVGDSKVEAAGPLRPTLIDGLPTSHELAREEVFGPVAALLHVDSSERALEVANESDYGLVTSVFTRDLDQMLTLVGELDTGLVRINLPTTGVDLHAPFGGEGASSAGPREQGKAAREIYTSTRTITVGPAGGS